MARSSIMIIPEQSTAPPVEAADSLCWAQGGATTGIFDINGTSGKVTWAAGGNPYGVRTDEETERIYWTTLGGNAKFADYDGTGITELFTGQGQLTGAEVDGTLFYFANWQNDRIRTCDKEDGSSITTIGSGSDTNDVRGISIDSVNGMIYYALRASTDIYRMELDGSNVTKILATTGWCMDLYADPDEEKIYYQTSGTTDYIRVVDYDGTNDTELYDTSTGTPSMVNGDGITVDLEAGHIFWHDVLDQYTGRSDLDGSGADNSWSSYIAGNPRGLDVVYPQGSFYAKPNR